MYLILLDDNNRIVAARDYTPGEDIPDGHIPTNSLPPGDMHDYRYEDGEFVYDPIPAPVVYVTADRRYNVGDLIEDNGEMFEVISIILAGSKLIPGSNIKQITLEEYINKKIEESTV